MINLKADTGDLIAVIRRISQVSNPKLPCVKLETEGNRMKISADSPYIGDGCEEMDVDKDGDDMTIAVNVHYLMDALKAVDSQETLIGIDSEVKPVVIRPSSEDRDHLCVIMPVRL
jgi:DNA polymerase-3 subunit beta